MSNKPNPSRFMRGTPVLARWTTAPNTALTDSLDGCTCTPVVHVYDAGGGRDGYAVLHDRECARLRALRAAAS